MYSRASLQELRWETGIRYDELTRGILHLYTDPEEFEAAKAPAELMRGMGLDRQLKTPEECAAIEPALASCQHLLAGGTYSDTDESGDAHKFTTELAKLGAERGVLFDFGVDIKSISATGEEITGIEILRKDGKPETIRADAYVLALGSYSPLFARTLGIFLSIYPAKGYSVTMPVKDPQAAWSVSLTDDEHKLVYSRLRLWPRPCGYRQRPQTRRGFRFYRIRLNQSSESRPASRVNSAATAESSAVTSVSFFSMLSREFRVW